MAQMASGGSLLNSMLEIVGAVTPTVETPTIDFPPVGEGAYIVVSNPPGNRTVAAQQDQAQILSMQFFAITGISNPAIRSPYTIMVRKQPGETTDIDYWGCSISVDSTKTQVQLMTNETYKYQPNTTYYLIKVKGM